MTQHDFRRELAASCARPVIDILHSCYKPILCVLALVTFLSSVDGHYLFCPYPSGMCGLNRRRGSLHRVATSQSQIQVAVTHSMGVSNHSWPLYLLKVCFYSCRTRLGAKKKPLIFHAQRAQLAPRVWPKTVMKQLTGISLLYLCLL